MGVKNDDSKEYQDLTRELQFTCDEVLFIQTLSEQNLQTRKLLACLNKSILQKAFHNEQEILTQFKSQMLDRMHSNDVALKEIYTKFFTLVSNIKDHAGCRSQNFHNIKNSLQLFCTKQQCEGEKKLEDESYLQGFKDETSSVDDSNAFLNESHTLAHHNLDDQVETCSQIPPVETCEQINKDFNEHNYGLENLHVAPDKRNLNAFDFGGKQITMMEEISTLSPENMIDKDRKGSISDYPITDQDKEYEVTEMISNFEEEHSIFKKPFTPKNRDVSVTQLPVFKRFMATPKEKKKETSVARSYPTNIKISNHSESPPIKCDSFMNFQSPKRSYPFESNHEYHSKMVTSSPEIFAPFQSPKFVFRRDTSLSPLYPKPVSEIPSTDLNSTNPSKLNHSSFELNFGIAHLEQPSNSHLNNTDEMKTSFFDFKSPSQSPELVSSYEPNCDSFGEKESFKDTFAANDTTSKTDVEKHFKFLMEHNLSIEEEEGSSSLFQLNLK